MPFPRVIPHSDGAGVIDRAGDGVPASRVGSLGLVLRGADLPALRHGCRVRRRSGGGRPCRCPTACPSSKGPASASPASPPIAASMSPGRSRAAWCSSRAGPARSASVPCNSPAGRCPRHRRGTLGRGRGRRVAGRGPRRSSVTARPGGLCRGATAKPRCSALNRPASSRPRPAAGSGQPPSRFWSRQAAEENF